MRSLRLAFGASLLGLCLVAACSNQDTGLLDLTLNADAQKPPPQATAVDLIGSGGVHRSYPGKFPPDGSASLRLEFPDLPAGTINLTVQTLDSKGCVVGESPAPFDVVIKTRARTIAAVNIQRSNKPCGDGGNANPGIDGGGIDGARIDDVGGGGSDDGGAGDAGDAGSDAARIDDSRASGGDSLRVDDAGGDSIDSARVDDVGGGAIDGARVGEAGVFRGETSAVDGLIDATTLDIAADFPAGPDTSGSPPAIDASSADILAVDAFQGIDLFADGADAPLPSPPTIISFTASPLTISAGASATLTAIFKNATGSSVDHGIGSLTSGNGVGTGALFATTTYKLTITDDTGASASQQVTVNVVPLPSITSFTALLPTIAVGTLTQLTATFTGGTGVIDQGVGSVTSGAGVSTGSLFKETIFTLTAKNAAGDLVERQLVVGVSSVVGTGTFTPTLGAMAIERLGHTATLLPNGKVLIAGGANERIAELYDPSSKTFRATAGLMTAGRMLHTATLLGNGKVLIVGGDFGLSQGQPSTGELYDPSTETFTSVGTDTAYREESGAALIPSGAVLIVGAGYGNAISTAEVFNPVLGSFTSTKNMSAGRQGPTATLLPTGQILVTGGTYSFMDDAGMHSGYLSTAELYNEGTGSFTLTEGSLIEPRAYATAILLLSGKVLLVGGVSNTVVTKSELYDPWTGWFQASGLLTDARYLHTATLLPNGGVLVAGGDLLSSAEVYDPVTGQFASAGNMSSIRDRHTANLLPSGEVLIVGGESGRRAAILSSAELYY
jgi:hypothetical protein